jgi:hypothetical protein
VPLDRPRYLGYRSRPPPLQDEVRDDTLDGREANERKGFGQELLGLFVETDSTVGASSAEHAAESALRERVSSTPGCAATGPKTNATAPLAAATAGPAAAGRPAPPASQKTPEFLGISYAAWMPDDGSERLAKAEEPLRGLPAETPIALKRQIVKGTMRAFAISPERIAAAAKRAVDALDPTQRSATRS